MEIKDSEIISHGMFSYFIPIVIEPEELLSTSPNWKNIDSFINLFIFSLKNTFLN